MTTKHKVPTSVEWVFKTYLVKYPGCKPEYFLGLCSDAVMEAGMGFSPESEKGTPQYYHHKIFETKALSYILKSYYMQRKDLANYEDTVSRMHKSVLLFKSFIKH